MKIAFVLDRCRPGRGGLEAWLAAFGVHLVARGHAVHLVTGDRRVDLPPFTHHPVRAGGLARPRRDRRFAESARRFCRTGGFDVVVGLRHCLLCHVYYPHGGSAAATFAGRSSAKAEELVELERELLDGDEPPARVVAVSDLVREDVARRYPAVADRVLVVPNGVDLDRFHPAGREGARQELGLDGERAVLFLAGNPGLKGFAAAREVFARLRAEGAAEVFLVAGGRPRGLPEGTRWLGRLERPETALAAADLLLQPTRYDPFPLTTLEALACGTPVATTRRNGAVAHLGEGGPVRAVAEPGDVDGLAALARELLATPLREEARRRAERFPLAGAFAAAESAVLGLRGGA